MSSVICQGCGQSFAVPAGYSRSKIQCPGCGVICQVPAGAAGASRSEPPAEPSRPARAERAERPAPTPARAERSFEDDAAAWLSESDDPTPERRAPRPREEGIVANREAIRSRPSAPVPAPAPEPEMKKPRVQTVPCRRCGRQILRQRECPLCDVQRSDEPLPLEPDEPPEPTFPTPPESRTDDVVAPISMELDDPPEEWVPPTPVEDDDEPAPYETLDKDKPRCPKCRKDMEFGAVLCASCGFDLRTRRKAKRRYDPIDRAWETDLSLGTRLMILGGVCAFHGLITVGTMLGGGLLSAVVSWFPLMFILTFVLGTYDRLRIVRDERGRVMVIRQWRFFFIPAPENRYEVRGYEGVLIGGWNDSGFWEWLICLSLALLICLPAFLWWYVAIYQNHYHVALAEDHGRASLTVYRGRSEEQMHDVAKVLCDASGLKILV